MNRRTEGQHGRSPSRGRGRDALRTARLLLGLSLRADRSASEQPSVSVRAVRALERVSPGGAYFICGPSGSGKTTHLRRLVRALRVRGETVIGMTSTPPAAACSKRLIDLGRGLSMQRWLTILAHAGLAEAGLFATRLRDLSTGQQRRAAAACTLARAERSRPRTRLSTTSRKVWIVADELTSGLDRSTALSLAAGLARFIAGTRLGTCPLRLLVTTHDGSFAEAIRPEVEVVCRLNAPAAVFTRSQRRRAS
ncbi:MAG: hypothetical protein IBJ18_13050 [Phycisphaerales bacterium]|nr:hypothetical protein [Phycisphaerales bacterium]